MAKNELFEAIKIVDEPGGGQPGAGTIDLKDINLEGTPPPNPGGDDKDPPNPGGDKPNPGGLEIIDLNKLEDVDPPTPGADDDKGTPGQDQHSSPFSLLATAFADRGFLNIPEEEKEKEAFMKKLEEMKDFNDFTALIDEQAKVLPLETLSDNQREYLDAMKAGVPQDEFHQYNMTVNTLEKLDDTQLKENKKLHESLIQQYYAIKMNDEDEATTIAKQMASREDSAELAAKAKDAILNYTKDVMKHKVKKGQEAQNKLVDTEKQNLQKVEEYINTTELFPKLQLSAVMKEKVINASTKIVEEDANGHPYNALMKAMKDDPVATNAKLNYLWVITNGLSTLSSVKNTAMSDATKAVEEIANRQTIGGDLEASKGGRHRATGGAGKITDAIKAALG